MAYKVKQLIEALTKWENPDAVILYQYMTSQNKDMTETEFAHVADFLETNDEFQEAMTKFMAGWLSDARNACAELSICCMANIFAEACDGCGGETEFVPVCEVCGRVDERQDLRRCTKHEANDDICFGCNYLDKIAGETMLDDGTTAKLCGQCFNRVEGGE